MFQALGHISINTTSPELIVVNYGHLLVTSFIYGIGRVWCGPSTVWIFVFPRDLRVVFSSNLKASAPSRNREEELLHVGGTANWYNI